jgi:hypothetical protein
MKQTLAFYRSAGRASGLLGPTPTWNSKMPYKTEFVKKYHPMFQTPGRAQYYRAEMLPWLSDDQKLAIRMANKIAMSNPKATYRNKVEEEVLRFI